VAAALLSADANIKPIFTDLCGLRAGEGASNAGPFPCTPSRLGGLHEGDISIEAKEGTFLKSLDRESLAALQKA
jgi:hypothetical protein